MKCQCTIAGSGFEARDIAAPWCEEEALTTVRVDFGKRTANLWVCKEHYDEYLRFIDC